MSATLPAVAGRDLEVWGGRLTLHVQVAGSGPPVLYLHPAAGLAWDPFLGALAERHTIYAPEVPGTSAGDPGAIHRVDDLSDLVLIYEEAVRALDLGGPAVAIGQSFGGMLVAELAAHFPALFSKIVLLGPIGLWHDEAPLANWIAAPPADLPAMLFSDPAGPAAQAMFTLPDDPEQAAAIQAGLVWALGCTGKFCWPIPERGLHKRLHRISAPALIVWGEQDALNPVRYADEFGSAIAGSRVEVIPDCGHIPQVEQMETTLKLVQEFLGR